MVSLKIRLLNTLGSAPVIPPQWRNDRGPSLKLNRETDPPCPRRGYGQFVPLHKSLGINGPRRKHLHCPNWLVDDFVAAQNLTHPPASTTGRQEHYGNNAWPRGYGRLSVTAICTSSKTPPNARVFSGGADATRTQPTRAIQREPYFTRSRSTSAFNGRPPSDPPLAGSPVPAFPGIRARYEYRPCSTCRHSRSKPARVY